MDGEPGEAGRTVRSQCRPDSCEGEREGRQAGWRSLRLQDSFRKFSKAIGGGEGPLSPRSEAAFVFLMCSVTGWEQRVGDAAQHKLQDGFQSLAPGAFSAMHSCSGRSEGHILMALSHTVD